MWTTIQKKHYIPKRYGIVFMTCLGMAISHAMRVNLAVTVVTILRNRPEVLVGHDVLAELELEPTNQSVPLVVRGITGLEVRVQGNLIIPLIYL